ncbi:MAG: phosphoribosylanthranilate isomerase [Planctomycetota bacterium]
MTRIKICGITRAEDACAAARAGAHALGLNFAPESPRFAGGIERARQLVAQAGSAAHQCGPGGILWAGVFVNPSVDEVLGAVRALGLQVVQLHGEEPAALAAQLKQRLGAQAAVWKAFRVGAEKDLAELQSYTCDAWLVDAKCSAVRGGSGQVFDWEILKALPRTRPLVLAGGLNPENVREAVRRVKPDWVDTASGVEAAPGVKDRRLIERFVRAVQTADEQAPA